MNFSFEIVPRSIDAFREQYRFVESLGDAIKVINVPDIQRFNIRSWEVNEFIDTDRYKFIPHFRAIDFNLAGNGIFEIIEQNQFKQILVVSGDPPEGIKRAFYNTDVVDLIRALKLRFPELNIYAGFDPHRQGIRDECEYIKRKIDAGVTGFFSQPFYDLRLIEIYVEQMQGIETYIGVSPIVSLSSKYYWEIKNKVKFPINFQPDYVWNIEFTKNVINLGNEAGYNIYFMPIKIDLDKYFGQLNFL